MAGEKRQSTERVMFLAGEPDAPEVSQELIDAARPGFMAAFDNPLDLSAERDAMQRELDETGVIAGLEDLKKIGSAIVSA